MQKISFLILILLITSVSFGQIKQRSTTEGLNVAAQLHMLGWSSEYFQYLDENAGSGVGGGLRVGYGITQLIEPYIGFDVTSLSVNNVDAQSFSMTHIDMGVRFNLAGTINAIRPFLEGGYSYRSGDIKEVVLNNNYADIRFSGGTPHLGGGVHYFPRVPLSIFAHGLFTVGKKSNLAIDDTKIDDKADITTFRIGIGISFNFQELMSR